jgi:hypothetical protein
MSIFADMATMHSVKSKVAGDFILVNATITRSLDWYASCLEQAKLAVCTHLYQTQLQSRLHQQIGSQRRFEGCEVKEVYA